MKRTISFFLTGVLLLSSGLQTTAAAEVDNGPESGQIDLSVVGTAADLEDAIEAQIDAAIQNLTDQWETFSAEIDSYDKYVENTDRVSEFYNTIIEGTNQIGIMIREDAAVYADYILASDSSAEDKYKAADDLYDCIYEDVCDNVYDEIYDGLLDDMYDYFYEGVIDEGYTNDNYSEWSDVSSKEYSQWSDAGSDVYRIWSDTSSDVYGFWSDFSGKLFSEDIEKAEKEVAQFRKKIEKLKSGEKGSGNSSEPAEFDLTIKDTASLEDLETTLEEQVNACVLSMYDDWAAFSTEIDTFEKYMENSGRVEEYYGNVVVQSKQILAMIENYTAAYAGTVCNSDITAREMYDVFEDLRDITYDDACEVVKDEIYDGLLYDMKDYFYDGIVKDGKDSVDYSEWSDTRSDDYDWWSDARSDTYDAWSDARSEIYGFISDARSELFGDDLDGALKEIERFKKKIDVADAVPAGEQTDDGSDGSEEAVRETVEETAEESAEGDIAETEEINEASTEEAPEETAEEAAEDTADVSAGEIRPEFKNAMDSYEAFYDQYCDIMKKMKENPSDMEVLTEYTDLLTKEAEVQRAFEEWDETDLNNAELIYYTEVVARVEKKLLEAVQGN